MHGTPFSHPTPPDQKDFPRAGQKTINKNCRGRNQLGLPFTRMPAVRLWGSGEVHLPGGALTNLHTERDALGNAPLLSTTEGQETPWRRGSGGTDKSCTRVSFRARTSKTLTLGLEERQHRKVFPRNFLLPGQLTDPSMIRNPTVHCNPNKG